MPSPFTALFCPIFRRQGGPFAPSLPHLQALSSYSLPTPSEPGSRRFLSAPGLPEPTTHCTSLAHAEWPEGQPAKENASLHEGHGQLLCLM